MIRTVPEGSAGAFMNRYKDQSVTYEFPKRGEKL